MKEFLLVVYGVLVGAIIMAAVFVGVVGLREAEMPTIICPPIVEAASQFRLFFDTSDVGAIPTPGPLDWEFAEACGFTTYENPVKVIPPVPEEGGA